MCWNLAAEQNLYVLESPCRIESFWKAVSLFSDPDAKSPSEIVHMRYGNCVVSNGHITCVMLGHVRCVICVWSCRGVFRDLQAFCRSWGRAYTLRRRRWPLRFARFSRCNKREALSIRAFLGRGKNVSCRNAAEATHFARGQWFPLKFRATRYTLGSVVSSDTSREYVCEKNFLEIGMERRHSALDALSFSPAPSRSWNTCSDSIFGSHRWPLKMPLIIKGTEGKQLRYKYELISWRASTAIHCKNDTQRFHV